jgi:rhodanese-related sulfurtransferase
LGRRPFPYLFPRGLTARAMNAAATKFEQIIPMLATDAEIIAFCRDTNCVYAAQAVAQLRKQGLRARRLAGGLPERREAEDPVLIHTQYEVPQVS